MAPKWRILLWLSHHTITNNDTRGCISDRYNGHERRMESIRTSTNDVGRITQKRWSYFHTVGEGTRQTYTTILCTTRILISTNHNIRTTQVNRQSAQSNRRRSSITQRINGVCNCGWRKSSPTNMLWTTIRQGHIVVLIRNMCNPSSNKTNHSTYQILQQETSARGQNNER